jgi:hypothetical protein
MASGEYWSEWFEESQTTGYQGCIKIIEKRYRYDKYDSVLYSETAEYLDPPN